MAAPRRRWYEKNPMVEEAIYTWQKFPRSLQRVVAKHVKLALNRNNLSVRLTGGPGKFLTIPLRTLTMAYFSHKRRRWYDHDPLVRSAVHTLSLVHHGDMVMLAERIIHLKVYLERQAVLNEEVSLKQFEDYVKYVFSKRNLKLY